MLTPCLGEQFLLLRLCSGQARSSRRPINGRTKTVWSIIRIGRSQVRSKSSCRRPIRFSRSSPRPSAATRRSTSGGEESTADDELRSAPFSYESFAISSPGAEETLWNIEGILNVTLNLQPALQPGHRVRVYFDGQPRMVNGTSFQIEEVWRGVHNVQAEVLDETGKLMIRSQPNRFYVQQNTVAGGP